MPVVNHELPIKLSLRSWAPSRWQASVFAFPLSACILTQLLDCPIEIALQFPLVTSHALKGATHDGLYLKVIDFLEVAYGDMSWQEGKPLDVRETVPQAPIGKNLPG